MLKLSFSSYIYVSMAFVLIIIVSYLNKILIEDKVCY